ncbi:MAG: 30S ribosomal protein S8 [Candidatus Levybacteria bacterium]|nr:30S ribosomal protein S8 [Candidatus Levybacteria bacterium]
MYTIADFVIKIKNAARAGRQVVTMPYSSATAEIGAILVKEGFLKSLKEETANNKKVIVATLQYEKRIPAVSDVAILSKPSHHVYMKANRIGALRRSLGVEVLSTNQGYMNAREAKKKGVGGELLFRIW